MNWPDDFINKVICGDCLEVMKEMPDECVDSCFADPPFNVGLDYKKFDDRKPGEEYWNWIEVRIREIFRVLKDNSRFYIFHTDIGIFNLRPICEKVGFRYHQQLIWYRPNLTGGTKITKDWHIVFENILLFHKGKRTAMKNSRWARNCFAILTYPSPQRNFSGGRDHPAQKPLGLMKHLIGRTPGKTIIFPFLGSGTDTRAAKDLKRNFIGIEINPDYCKIAEERLAQGVL